MKNDLLTLLGAGYSMRLSIDPHTHDYEVLICNDGNYASLKFSELEMEDYIGDMLLDTVKNCILLLEELKPIHKIPIIVARHRTIYCSACDHYLCDYNQIKTLKPSCPECGKQLDLTKVLYPHLIK